MARIICDLVPSNIKSSFGTIASNDRSVGRDSVGFRSRLEETFHEARQDRRGCGGASSCEAIERTLEDGRAVSAFHVVGVIPNRRGSGRFQARILMCGPIVRYAYYDPMELA